MVYYYYYSRQGVIPATRDFGTKAGGEVSGEGSMCVSYKYRNDTCTYTYLYNYNN